ncbi:hypothetical protein HK100_012141 [Physocladia obscura]|uniref:Uncharacterized protein n=1 Tax=Physocladia obscura TaxID=109957 RepID=A0AAD5XCQ2_9FUNG|nr:hypothetical protein HK100_012141 [Physocladia obscura]
MSVATTISGLIPKTAVAAATVVTAAAAQLPSWNATTAVISRLAGNTLSGGDNEVGVSKISFLFVGGGGDGKDAGPVPTRSALSETENSSGGGMAEVVGGFAKNVSVWAGSGRVVAAAPKVAAAFEVNSGNSNFDTSKAEQTLHNQFYQHQQQQFNSQPINPQFGQQNQQYYQQHLQQQQYFQHQEFQQSPQF